MPHTHSLISCLFSRCLSICRSKPLSSYSLTATNSPYKTGFLYLQYFTIRMGMWQGMLKKNLERSLNTTGSYFNKRPFGN